MTNHKRCIRPAQAKAQVLRSKRFSHLRHRGNDDAHSPCKDRAVGSVRYVDYIGWVDILTCLQVCRDSHALLRPDRCISLWLRGVRPLPRGRWHRLAATS